MKVLFATYPVAFHTPGGGEIQLMAYQKHLPAHEVDVALFDPWNPDFLEHDVVHFFSCVGGSVHFCRFVKQLGLPLVISSSLWVTETTRALYPVDEIRAQLELADRVIANSDIECDTLSRVLGLPREKFITVYNGVEDMFFDKPDPGIFRNHFDIHESFILNVGNIEPRKNQLRLARAMRALPDYKLVLIGHIRDEAYFERVMEVSGGQVTHIGSLPHESPLLRSAYQACELFALPSTLETPGLAALEAAAQGLIVVVTQEGSTREYFADTAIYVDPESDESIRQGIGCAIDRRRSRLDENRLAQRVIENYTWSHVTEQLSSAYRIVMSEAESVINGS